MFTCSAPLTMPSASSYHRLFRTLSRAGVCVTWAGSPFDAGAVATFTAERAESLVLVGAICSRSTISEVKECR